MNYATNPKATFDYDIQETLEAGIVLTGGEVKSVKKGHVSLKGSYAKVLSGEAWLVGATISAYQPNNMSKDYDPMRSRKLLLRASELAYITGKAQEQGYTMVPIRLYSRKNKVKLEIGLGRGKKKYDKRATIAKRDTDRDIRRAIKKRI